MMARAYLVIVGVLYLGLALWCAMQPAVTSKKVGFQLIGGSGQSEFMTVYGGLEFGMALIFIVAACRDTTVQYGVLACVFIHVSLVVFRTISFFVFSDIERFTYQLAIGEWIISLIGIAILVAGSGGRS